MRMKLEPVTQSEVSKKEKNTCCILTHTYGIQKSGTEEPMCRAGMEVQTQGTGFRTQGAGEGEGGMN